MQRLLIRTIERSNSFRVHGAAPKKTRPVAKASFNMTRKFLKKHLDFAINEHGEMPALKLSTLNPTVEFDSCDFLKTRTTDELRALDHDESDTVVDIARQFMGDSGIDVKHVRIGATGGNQIKLTITYLNGLSVKPKRLERLVKRHIISELPKRLNRTVSDTERLITKRHYTKNVDIVFVQSDSE